MKLISSFFLLLFSLGNCLSDERLTFHVKPKPLPEGAVVENWPRFLGPHDDGTSKETKLLKRWGKNGPSMVWELERGDTYASPTVSDGKLFSFDLADGHERLECRNPETGILIWDFKYPVKYRDRFGYSSGPRASPVIDNEILILAGVTAQLRGISTRTGKELWHIDLQKEYGHKLGFFGYGPAPIFWNNLVIVNLGGAKDDDDKRVSVAAFNRKTGDEVWTYKGEWGASYSSPVIKKIRDKDVLLVFAGGEGRPSKGGLLALNPESGELYDRFSWRADSYESVNASVPVVIDNDKVFVSECYGNGGVLLQFDKKHKLSVVWKERWFGMHWMTPLVIGDYLYGFSGRNKPDVQFKCSKISDGSIAWKEDMRYQFDLNGRDLTLSFFRGSLLRCNNRVFALGEDGVLAELEISPKGVKTLSQSQLFVAEQSWALPVIHRGLLYISQHTKGFVNDTKPRLMCFDFRESKINNKNLKN